MTSRRNESAEEIADSGAEEEVQVRVVEAAVGEEEGNQAQRVARGAAAAASSAALGDRLTTSSTTPTILGPDDPQRMVLTTEERELALRIKAAIEVVEDVEPMTDFMCAQFAIIALLEENRDDDDDDDGSSVLDKTMERIEHYQQFIQEHNIIIHNNHQAACNIIDRAMKELVPEHYLSFSYHPGEGCYVLALDTTKFDARSVLSDHQKHNIHLAATHYMMKAQLPDFEAIRRGIITIYECMGYEWRSPHMFNIHCCRSLASLTNVCPIRPRSLRLYNTGVFVNLMLSMGKRMVPNSVINKFEPGWQCGGDDNNSKRRLSDVLVVPDRPTTTERNMSRIRIALQKRYTNERTFQL